MYYDSYYQVFLTIEVHGLDYIYFMALCFKEWFLTESKQTIINLGYPEVIAKLLYEKFGAIAPLIAKWFREHGYSREVPANWWLQTTGDYRRTPSLYDLTILYAAADNPETYKNAINQIGLSRTHEDEDDLPEQKKALEAQIKSVFFDNLFFNYSIVQDIQSGKLRDIAPYKKLKFQDAQHKYDEKNIFQNKTPIKTYKDGFKWIDVGKRCVLVGSLMGNCGSAGLMSMDKDRTLVVLFGPENTPHVVMTYSPNEKRISGDEGVGSTEVKSKYHDYILDLAKTLGATFDVNRSKSKLLQMKYLLQNKATGLQQIATNDNDGEFFRFNVQGKEYYSDGYSVMSGEDMMKAQAGIKQRAIVLRSDQGNLMKNMFHHMNQPAFAAFGVNYIPMKQF